MVFVIWVKFTPSIIDKNKSNASKINALVVLKYHLQETILLKFV